MFAFSPALFASTSSSLPALCSAQIYPCTPLQQCSCYPGKMRLIWQAGRHEARSLRGGLHICYARKRMKSHDWRGCPGSTYRGGKGCILPGRRSERADEAQLSERRPLHLFATRQRWEYPTIRRSSDSYRNPLSLTLGAPKQTLLQTKLPPILSEEPTKRVVPAADKLRR